MFIIWGLSCNWLGFKGLDNPTPLVLLPTAHTAPLHTYSSPQRTAFHLWHLQCWGLHRSFGFTLRASQNGFSGPLHRDFNHAPPCPASAGLREPFSLASLTPAKPLPHGQCLQHCRILLPARGVAWNQRLYSDSRGLSSTQLLLRSREPLQLRFFSFK